MASAAEILSTSPNELLGEPCIRGVALLSQRHYVREHHPEIAPQLRERISDEARALLDEDVLGVSWYDSHLVHEIGGMIFFLINDDALDAAHEFGRWVAAGDLRGGVFRAFVRIISPRLILKASANGWRHYSRSGRFQAVELSSNRTRVALEGYCCSNGTWWATLRGYSIEIMRLAGGHDVHLEVLSGGREGDHYMEYEVSWS